MSKIDLQTFIRLLRRSKLIEEAAFDNALSSYEREVGEGLPHDAEALSDYLVDQGLITGWQAAKVLKGKYKGYFLGKYKLLDHLGTGGMSSVYLAQHTMMRTLRAIKVLPRTRVDDSSYLGRFILEATAAGALDHPHIVRTYDIDNTGDTHYIVMEYVKGKDLQQVVEDLGPLDFPVVADYISQAAHGLAYAHDKGLIHRDIKPANLLVNPSGVVKVLDMGLARLEEYEEASLTLAHNENVLGTADYLSPEQAVNSHEADARADIYSLGCTMYFLLSGQPPFSTGSLAQRIAKHQTVMPEPIEKIREDCPDSLAQICVKMIRKKRKSRYQTAEEVSADLERWLKENAPEYRRQDQEAYLLHSMGDRRIAAPIPASADIPQAAAIQEAGSIPRATALLEPDYASPPPPPRATPLEDEQPKKTPAPRRSTKRREGSPETVSDRNSITWSNLQKATEDFEKANKTPSKQSPAKRPPAKQLAAKRAAKPLPVAKPLEDSKSSQPSAKPDSGKSVSPADFNLNLTDSQATRRAKKSPSGKAASETSGANRLTKAKGRTMTWLWVCVAVIALLAIGLTVLAFSSGWFDTSNHLNNSVRDTSGAVSP